MFCDSQNEEFTIYSDYADNYMEAVLMVRKLVNKRGAPDYLGVSLCVYACMCMCMHANVCVCTHVCINVCVCV